MTDEQRTAPGSMDLRPVPNWVIGEVRHWAEQRGIVGSGLAIQIRSALADWATEQMANRREK